MKKDLQLLLVSIVGYVLANILATVVGFLFVIKTIKDTYKDNFNIAFSIKGIKVNGQLYENQMCAEFLIASVIIFILFTILFLYFSKKLINSVAAIGLVEPKHIIFASCLIVFSIVTFVSVDLYWGDYINGESFDALAFVKNAKNQRLLFLLVAIVVPIVEELIFRGALYNFMMSATKNAIVTGVVVAFVFTFLHFQYNFIVLSIMFFMALLLSYLRYKTESIYPGIVMHIINNSIPFFHVWFFS